MDHPELDNLDGATTPLAARWDLVLSRFRGVLYSYLYGFQHCIDINAHRCDSVLFCPVRHIPPLFDLSLALVSFPFAVLARAGLRDGDPLVTQISWNMTIVSGAE